MQAKERRQFEMLQRIENFGKSYRHLLAASSAQQALAAVSAAIEALRVTATAKVSASAAARADRKRKARKALDGLLVRVNRLAGVLGASGRTLPAFAFPTSRSDEALLTAARHFARDSAAAEAEFDGHGMGPRVIAETADAFQTALRDGGMSRAERMSAGTRIRDLIAAAINDVRRLDLMVQNELAHDNVAQDAWKHARRVDEARSSRDPAPAQGSPPEAAATSPAPQVV